MSLPRRLLESKNARMLRMGMNALGACSRAAGRMPSLLKFHPWTNSTKTDVRWLPINQNIQMPDNAPMPLTLAYRLIEEASHRVIYDFCSCRKAFECKNYPEELGCLLMGDSAIESPPSVSREVGVAEAKEHARKAVDAGLIPLVGKARIDNSITGIKDRGKLLTLCFCCECCCIARNTRYLHPEILEPMFPRLDGVSVEVIGDCTGCGECADNCYIHAIEVKEGRAVIGEYCRACGRCATICPNDAIRVSIGDPYFLDKCYERIRSYVKFN